MRPPEMSSVADAQRRARKRVPRSVYRAFSQESATGRDNIRALREVGFRPRVATRFAHHDLATTILGRPSTMPLVAAPVGALRLAHRDAEIGVAQAASAAGIPVGLSTSAHHRVEDVANAATTPLWYQLYLAGGRGPSEAAIERARACGCQALVLTVDMLGVGVGTKASSKRNQVPNKITVHNAVRYAPEMLTRPRWFADYAREGLRLKAGNVRPSAGGDPLDFSDALPISATWEDVEWIKQLWSGPLVIKGILRTDDAKRAADVGATAVVVSNHGGLVLDGVTGSLRALPGVVETIGDQVEVFFDGGIRTGADVVKALGLGAKAVLCGRACVWGLAAGGSMGVRQVLEWLRNDIEVTLAGLGCRSVDDVRASDLDLPAGWPARTGPL